MGLSIESQSEGAAVVVVLKGQLDTMTSKPFETFLSDSIKRGNRRIVVDLSDVNYVSSYGLRVFLLTAKLLRADKRGFILCSLTAEVKKIFKISGFDKILTLCETRAEAVALASA